MSILHIFNPDHDMALAYNKTIFTAPHAARQMRADLAFIPALWANDGDYIMVDDIEAAKEKLRHIQKWANKVEFITPECTQNKTLDEIDVWGWNKSIKNLLSNWGMKENLLPNSQDLSFIRTFSHRAWTIDFLEILRHKHTDFYIGERKNFSNITDVEQYTERKKNIVLKEPWSCSGRGIRYIRTEFTSHQLSWCKNVIKRQGSIIAEPYYNKVLDFGMEFYADKHEVKYQGLSIFMTHNGMYVGNVIACEDEKIEMLTKYIDAETLCNLRHEIESILTLKITNEYEGPLGIDMMIVGCSEKQKCMIHPCVEINFRKTMGHVALSLGNKNKTGKKLFTISYDGSYHARIIPLTNDFVTVI